VAEVNHPKAGPVKIIGSPLNFSDSKLRAYEPPPLLGQHTDDILRDRLGYDAAKLAALKDKKVIS